MLATSTPLSVDGFATLMVLRRRLKFEDGEDRAMVGRDRLVQHADCDHFPATGWSGQNEVDLPFRFADWNRGQLLVIGNPPLLGERLQYGAVASRIEIPCQDCGDIALLCDQFIDLFCRWSCRILIPCGLR